MPMDRKDPQHPTDILDRPIKEGDFVIYPISLGRTPGLAIGPIIEIVFKKYDNDKYKDVKCAQNEAEKYSLRIKSYKRAGFETTNWEPMTKGDWNGPVEPKEQKASTILNVENVFLTEPVKDQIWEDSQRKAHEISERNANKRN